MRLVVSILIFTILVLWLGTLFFTDKKKFRTVEYNKGEKYLLSRNMYFAIFTVCTAPIFLGALSLLKYGLWFVILLFLLFSGRIRMRIDAVLVVYLIFFLWLCFTMTYTTAMRDGYMMLVKYSF